MSDTGIFQGFEFFIDLDQRAPDTAANTLASHLNSQIQKLGGQVVEKYRKECTHLVLRHEEQEVFSKALENDQSVVSVEYVIRCFEEKTRVPESGTNGIFKGQSIPGIGDKVNQVTLTDFRGMSRLLLRYKCESTGAPYSGILTVPGETSHLVVKNLKSSSEKVEKARHHPSVHVVSFRWIDECLKQWKYVPEGPFEDGGARVAESSQDECTNICPAPERNADKVAGTAKNPAGPEKNSKGVATGKPKSGDAVNGPTNPKEKTKPGADDGAMEEDGEKEDKRSRGEDESPMGPAERTPSRRKGAQEKKGAKKREEEMEEEEGDDTGTEGGEGREVKRVVSRKKVGRKSKQMSGAMKKGSAKRGEAAKRKPTTKRRYKEVSTEPSESEEEEMEDEMEEPRSSRPRKKLRKAPKGGSKHQSKSKPQTPSESDEELLFAVSAMGGDDRANMQAALTKLGLEVSTSVDRDPHAYDVGTTHIILQELRRNQKTVCGMAAGNWILHADYVGSCRAAGDLVDEEPFELSKMENGNISEGAPAHWRNRFDKLGVGAFHGVNACFYGKLGGPGNDAIQRMIEAGGGKVLKKSPPYADVLKQGDVAIAIIGKDKGKKTDRSINMFLEGGVPCVSEDYVINWVAHPDMDLEEFVLFDPEGGCEHLVALENGRGTGNGCSENSMSF